MSLLTLSRWQFAVTVMFHMTFPAITVGTSILLSVLYGMHWKTQEPVYLQMFRFWRRIFAIGLMLSLAHRRARRHSRGSSELPSAERLTTESSHRGRQ